MQVFYAPEIATDSEVYTLDENESRHVVRVLRMRAGAHVTLIDGRGNLFEGLILIADAKRCTIKITSARLDFEPRDYRLHIAISPIKNTERFEWFIEKAVEIGIDEVTPLICKNSEKITTKEERIRNIIVSAMKQSLKASNTILHEPCLFNDFVRSNQMGKTMIAHCFKEDKREKIGDIYQMHDDATILIGPEGDFTREEISFAQSQGYTPIHMGNSRLRTETAGVAACFSIYFINEK